MFGQPERGEFEAFVAEVEPRLLHALVARYGPVLGRDATVDALSWAWEHWGRLAGVRNRVGYLFRVGQTAARRSGPQRRHLSAIAAPGEMPDVEPQLVPALATLPDRQRVVVVLVHAFGWTQAEVAQLLEVSPSTVQQHLVRGLARLREHLEVEHVG